MKNIKSWLSRKTAGVFDFMGNDGMKHALVSALVCGALRFVLVFCGFCYLSSGAIAAIVTLCVGFVGEMIDVRNKGGEFDSKDMLCNFIGVAVGFL